MSPDRPILWSFRRCPYAMRARLAVAASGVPVTLREVVLRDKPDAFLQASPSATVPCLQGPEGVIDESFDIMLWALRQNDPEGWVDMPKTGFDLIETSDGPFKQSLDRYKYASRHPDRDPVEERSKASAFLQELEARLQKGPWLFGERAALADMAILPFVRQFAHTDLEWFEAQDWPALLDWLNRFKASERFQGIMPKFPRWQPGDAPIAFP